MKTLLLMRHAKSSWKDTSLPDHERPLNKRGNRDAPRMGKLIKETELIPQKIFSSSAVRARATAEAVIDTSGFNGEVEYLDSLYLCESSVIMKLLKKLPDDLERVLVIGHNPGLEGLVQVLSREIESLPTAAIAYIVLPIKKWNDIDDDTYGELINLWKPRNLSVV